MENKITNSIWLGVAVRDTADDASANDNPFVFTDGTLVDDDKMILKFLDAFLNMLRLKKNALIC